MDKEITKMAIFKGKSIRKVIFNDEWWFVVEDVVLALTDTVNVKDYINKIRLRDAELSKGYGQIVHTLWVETLGGRQQMNCANTEGIFRIIQSIPSPKAEPFKRWLARVGYERVKEIEDPELGTKRTRMLYKLKGYPEGWIEKRMRGIAVRETLTNEWDKRGVKNSLEYAILTNEIMNGAFDMDVDDYKKFKSLQRENLRDHMDDMELILTMLGEAATTRFSRDRDSKGFPKLKVDAKDGGEVAGNARREIEKKSSRQVSTPKNYLQIKRLKKLGN